MRLNDYAYLLHPGDNVLAFQVVNYADDDVDLLIEPTLRASLRANDVPFEFNAQTGWWNLDNGTIVGGEISTTDEVGLNVTSSYGKLDRVTLVSDFTIPPGFYFYARNGLTLDQVTLTLAQPEEVAATSRVDLVGHSRLAGSGIVRLEMNSWGYTSHLGGEIVGVDANVTVAGTGYFWAQELYNQGTIVADGSGETLDVYAEKLVNSGALSATNGSTLTVSGLTGDVGNLILLDEGSALRLDGMDYVLNQSITIGAGQVLTLEGSWSNVATITVEAGGTLNLGGSFTLSDAGSIVSHGGAINITGTLDNRAPRDVELIGATTTWSYFVPSDGSLGSSWQLPSFGTPPTAVHNVASPNDVNNDG
ncbi:MAG: hypothetical protein KDA59_02515, partial [Planctomycetales bacterium]|nr:hypothetical protein [Planctomycetales bacterium]